MGYTYEFIAMIPAPKNLPRVDEVCLKEFRAFKEPNGTLVPVTGGVDVPFPIARIFYVYDVKRGRVRGEHAHRQCHQMLLCLHGACEVTVDDGRAQRSFLLDKRTAALHIPAGLWASQTYLSADTVVVVFASRRYEEEDYIREYDAFISYRGLEGGKQAAGHRAVEEKE